jgi:cytochrome c2
MLGVIFVAVTFWTVWDETFTRRPWKAYQKNFNTYEKTLVTIELTEAQKKTAKEIGEIDGKLQGLRSKLENDPELAKLQNDLENLKLTAFEKVQDFAFSKAIFDQAYFELNEGIRQGRDVSTEQKHVEEIKKEIAQKQPLAEKAEASRDALEAKIKAKFKPLVDLERRKRTVAQDVFALERRLDAINKRPYEIQQIVLREYERNNFGEPVIRVDRCKSCHLGVDKGGFEKAPKPFPTHPDRKFYLGKHDVSKIGCASCHGGQGSALKTVKLAHGFDHFWEDPLLPSSEIESKCFSCHSNQFNLRKAPTLSRAISLVRELGCFGCHNIPGTQDLREVGPDLSRIQEKVTPDWLVSWVKRPKDYNPRTKMPYFGLTDKESKDIATYLWAAGPRKASPQKINGLNDPATIKLGKEVFESVGCLACHIRDEKDLKPGPKLEGVNGWPIVFQNRDFAPALGKIGQKVQSDWLVRWVKNPKNYWHDTKMPSLRLSDKESKAVAAYLISLSPSSPRKININIEDKAAFERGRALVRKRGCFGCHNIPGMETASQIGPNLARFASKKYFELSFGNVVNMEHTWDAWVFGKLKNPKLFQTDREKLLMPNFDLSDKEVRTIRTLLRAMVPHGPPHSVHQEFNEKERKIELGRRMIEKYNCTACHVVENWGGDYLRRFKDRNNGPPMLNGQGAKVQPDWFYGFLQNVVTLRPWLKVRMPSFQMPNEDVAALVNYFAALDDKLQPYVHFNKKQVKKAVLKAGKELFEKAECLSCHGEFPPPAGKEPPSAPSLDLAKSRLLPKWIVRWIRNPQKIQPGTKMPVFFEGAGIKAAILSGVRGEKKDKLWSYTLKTATEAELPEEQPATLRIGSRTIKVEVAEIDEKSIKITSPVDLGAKFSKAELESHGEPIDPELLGGDGYRQMEALRDYLMTQKINALSSPKSGS